MADFQKLGLDRLAQNIARSVNSAPGTLVTGDITKGEVVEVTASTTTKSTSVSPRRTGAILISLKGDSEDPKEVTYWIDGSQLKYKVNTGTAEMSFWVF